MSTIREVGPSTLDLRAELEHQNKQPSLDHGKSAEPSEPETSRAADEFANRSRRP